MFNRDRFLLPVVLLIMVILVLIFSIDNCGVGVDNTCIDYNGYFR